MKIKKYDTFIMGHISIDENIYQGETVKEIGGAVIILILKSIILPALFMESLIVK